MWIFGFSLGVCPTELHNLVFPLEYLVSNKRQVLLRGIRLGGSTTLCFNCFHLVSIRCIRCCSPRTLTRGQAHAAPCAPAPLGVVPHARACSRLNTYACMLYPLPLSFALAHVRCALSCLSHLSMCVVLFLSLACS